MKKLTIKQFAQVIRYKNPKKFDNLSDNVLSLQHLKKFPLDAKYLQLEELVKLGIDVAKGTTDKVKNYVNDKIDSTLTPDVKDSLKTDYDKIKNNLSSYIKNSTSVDQKGQTQSDIKNPQTQPSQQDQKYQLHQTNINFGPDQPVHVDTNIPTKSCSDFPFTFGCQNKIIGDINQALFKNRLNDTFDTHLYKELTDNGFFNDTNEKQGEISKIMYDKIKRGFHLNENKKIIKETVKKVLKGSIKEK